MDNSALGDRACISVQFLLASAGVAKGSPGLGLIVSSNIASIAVSSLAIYAGIVLLLSTAITLVDLRCVLSRLSVVLAPTRAEWFASFEGAGLARLAARLLDLADEDISVSGHAVLRFRFDIGFGRQEIQYLFRNSLTRVHFFTALVALIGMAGLGWAREQGLIALPGLAIPGGPIFAVVAALIALFALATFAVNAAAELLVDEIADLRLGDARLVEAGSSHTDRHRVSSSRCHRLERFMPANVASASVLKRRSLHGRLPCTIGRPIGMPDAAADRRGACRSWRDQDECRRSRAGD